MKHLKILLIGNYLPDEQQSMIRYAKLVQATAEKAGHRATLVAPPAIFGQLRGLPAAARKWFGYVDKYLLAPVYLRWMARDADLVHVTDHSNSMYLRLAGSRAALITCHDLLAVNAAAGCYPGVRVGQTGRLLQRWITKGLRRARYVLSVSEKTAEDMRGLNPDPGQNLYVVHNPLNRRLERASMGEVERVLSRHGVAPGTRYLLHVGGNQWYKNRIGVLQIWSILRMHEPFRSMKMLLAGKPWTESMCALHATNELGDSALQLVEVNDAELTALYSGAEAMLFPSLEEGFGWPILEAQTCGCPVITSSHAPMSEVGGEASLYIDAYHPAAAAETILAQWESRLAVREKAESNLERFDADRIARSYADVYQQVYADWVQHRQAGDSDTAAC